MTITVGPNDTVIEVKDSATGETTSVPVTPGKSVTLPVPDVPPGTFITYKVGDGKRNRGLTVEVIAPSP